MSPSTQEYEFSGTTEQKIERLIYYATRQGNTLSMHASELAELRGLLRDLEAEKQRRAVEDARMDERDKALLGRLDAVEKSMDTLKPVLGEVSALKTSVDGMKGVLNKAIGLIATAIGLALLNWMLSGGMQAATVALKKVSP